MKFSADETEGEMTAEEVEEIEEMIAEILEDEDHAAAAQYAMALAKSLIPGPPAKIDKPPRFITWFTSAQPNGVPVVMVRTEAADWIWRLEADMSLGAYLAAAIRPELKGTTHGSC